MLLEELSKELDEELDERLDEEMDEELDKELEIMELIEVLAALELGADPVTVTM